ncbi:MAG TPA: hypothetical protein VN032_04575 [Thermoanaerobaculia bacterium]|jgi:hypothetical protein|nr:hypothetical protein [Thermoanaerobaculia bacterium]
MSTKARGQTGQSDPFPEDEIETYHSPEPWTQDGRYIRDARGAIVVRGRTQADARRITAAINATRDIPTDALEHWLIQDVSDPVGRPDLEVAFADPEPSPFAVPPPEGIPVPILISPEAPPADAPWPYSLTHPERRRTDRRDGERRHPESRPGPDQLVFDRRVMERRFGERRAE